MKLNSYISILVACFLVIFSTGVYAQVTVTSSDSINCANFCTTLTAHLEGDTPTDAGITSDDVYSTAHAIGFTFSYWGINYTSCVIGANGTIDFNASDAGSGDPWTISAALAGNPSKYNNICGPWCDIDIFYTGAAVGTETYSTDGVAPFRKFVITWCSCSMFECSSQHTTSQIILYETTNIIEVHVAHKDICTSWNPSSPTGAGGRAIIGVEAPASLGGAAVVAPGRDWTPVWSASDEAWRFTPTTTGSGAASYTVASIPYAPVPYESSNIYWYNASTGAYLGMGDTLHVCPTTTTAYKAGALGCADTSFGYYTVIPSGVGPTPSLSFTNPTLCNTCDGTITLSGLTPNYSDTINYEIGGVPQPPVIAIVTAGGTVTFTNLCPGTYSNFTVKELGCTSPPVGPIILGFPGISISSVTTTDPTFCGVCDGTLTINGLYPNDPFTITYTFNGVAVGPVSAVSTPAGTITISGLCAGTYDNIVATLTSGCVTPPVGPNVISNPTPPDINIVNFTNPSECGFCNGTLTIRGVTPYSSDTINYSLNGVAQTPIITVTQPDSSIILTGLCAGAYAGFSVKIGACVYGVIGTATLAGPPLTAAFDTTTHFGCHGDTVFFHNSSTSVGPLYYVWNFGDGTTDTSLNPYHIYPQGSYTVTLLATNHFCSDSMKQAISLIHPLHASFIDTPGIACQGKPLMFTNTSVATDPSYNWSFGNGATDTNTNTSYAYPNVGAYTVQLVVTDWVPCRDTATAIVYVDTISGVNIGITDTVICSGAYVTFTGLYASIGNTGVTWSFASGDSLKNVNPVSYAYTNTSGLQTITLTAHYRVCPDTSTSRTIYVYPQPTLNLGPDTSICIGSESIVLSDNANAANETATWVWSTGQTGPSITVVAPGVYYATVNINNCYASDSILVSNDCYMNIPNVFTPNGDGTNDYFYPRQYLTKGLTSFKMDIFNRWGQLVFETTSLDGRGWDGRFNNIDQPEGVFVYIIEATFRDGQKEHHEGNVTLLR